MKTRLDIIHKVLQADIENKLPVSFKITGNITTEHWLLSKMLRRLGKNKDIGMSTESDKNLVWFRRRRK
jgi:hypothetical protein